MSSSPFFVGARGHLVIELLCDTQFALSFQGIPLKILPLKRQTVSTVCERRDKRSRIKCYGGYVCDVK